MRKDKPSEEQSFVFDQSSMEITDEKFMEISNQTVAMVEDVAFSSGAKSLMPVIFVHYKKIVDEQISDMEISIYGISSDFNDADVKRDTLNKIGRDCFEKRLYPVAVFMASEAWMSHKNKEDIYDGIMPRQDPNRKEVIIIAGKTVQADCYVGVTIPFTRNEKDEMVRSGETITTKEIQTPLLDNFFIGFFKALEQSKTGKQEKPCKTTTRIHPIA